MSEIQTPSGSALKLELLLKDGETGKFPVAHVYNTAGTAITGSPFTLAHNALGNYIATTPPSPADGKYRAIFITYNEVGHTTEAAYKRTEDNFDVNPKTADIAAILVDTGTTIPATLATQETKAQADARQVLLIAEHDATQATLATQETKAQADARQVLLIAEHDATQVAIAALNNLSAAQAADAVWDELLSGHVAAGSMGANQNLIDNIESKSEADIRQLALVAEHDATQAAIAALNDISIADVQTALTNQGYTAARAILIDNLDVLLSTRSTQSSVDAIDAIVDAILVDTGTTIPALIAALNDPSAADNADAIWDELLAGHTIAGSAGEALSNAGAGASPSDIADAVWNALTATHTTADTFGLFIQSFPDPATIWDELRSSHTAVGTFGEVVDAAISSRATQASVDVIDAIVDAILVDTGTDIPALIAALNDLSIADVQTAMTNQGYTAARAILISNLDVLLSTRSTQASVDVIDAIVDAILVDTGTTIPGILSAIETKLQADARQALLIAEHNQTQSDIAGLNNLDAATVADAVWDEVVSGHLTAGTFGKAIDDLLASASVDVAGQVWDALTASHTDAGSFGLLMDVIEQFVSQNNVELVDGATGLSAIKQEVINQHLNTVSEINANEVKIDDIRGNQDVVAAALNANIDSNEIKIDAIIPQIVASEASIIAEIDVNEVKIDEILVRVNAIQNNTTVRFVVPETILKPESGDPTKVYQFHLRLYDTDGNPEAPDSTPTVRVRSLSSGSDIILNDPMTQDGTKVGAYFYDYPISSGSNLDHLLVEATVVENGVTRYVPAVTEVVEFQTDLDAIQAQLGDVEVIVTENKQNIENTAFGLSAIRTEQDNTVVEIDQNEALLNLIKPQTDLIPADPATETTLATIIADVAAVPDILEIQARLDLQTSSLKGTGGRDLTDVYDKIDFSGLLQTTDPRLDHLDADISSRSTLTAAEVWSYVTRELTDITITAADLEAVWDTLLTAATTPGSFGELIKTNIDAPVSGAATEAEMTALLVGVAQEATLSGFISDTGINFAQVDAANTSIKLDTAAIKPKTDLIPASPASEATLTDGITDIQADIADSKLVADGIKAKTDNLPLDPASEGSVSAIPTNPLLTNDARLNTLDADISSRSTLDATDLAPLATSAELASTESNLTTEINTVEAKVDQVDLEVGLVKGKTDNLPLDPASDTQVIASQVAVQDDIAALPPPGGGASAADVWAFPTREITNDPNDFKADVSGLATPGDIPNEYENRMSTAFNNTTGNQEVLVWAQKDGQRVVGSNANVTVKDANGVVKWTQILASPNADGVFKFVNAISVAADSNFYVDIEITVDAEVRKSLQPFFTTG